MFEVKRPEKKPIVVIRTASAHELSAYELQKLKNIEDGAQVNKIEAITVSTPSQAESIVTITNKVANIELGDLACKDKVTPEEISAEELFLIECSLEGENEST